MRLRPSESRDRTAALAQLIEAGHFAQIIDCGVNVHADQSIPFGYEHGGSARPFYILRMKWACSRVVQNFQSAKANVTGRPIV